MFDYFIAALRCSACGSTSRADSSTNMQTHLRDDADARELGVGFELDPLEVRPQDVAASGYLPVSPQPADGTFTLLETWECPTCRTADQWARIDVRDGVITAIAGVTLDRRTLEAAHFISDQCFLRASTLSEAAGRALIDGTVDPVAVLREHLPPGRG